MYMIAEITVLMSESFLSSSIFARTGSVAIVSALNLLFITSTLELTSLMSVES